MALFISDSVGINAANDGTDVIAVKEAFNHIPSFLGVSPNEIVVDGSFTQELLDVIFNFQSFHHLAVVDGIIDPNKSTHKQINLALDAIDMPPPIATVSGLIGDAGSSVPTGYPVAVPSSLPGVAHLQELQFDVRTQRRHIHVANSSLNWFGVVLPDPLPADGNLGIPHICFTPTPHHGGYQDVDYASFNNWFKLWEDYTYYIGAQVVFSGARQVLVLPFYRTGQANDLGDFLLNWQWVIPHVVRSAVNDIDPAYAEQWGGYDFSELVSSHFSDGCFAHQNFNTRGLGAAALTRVIFNFEGAAARPPCNWEPANSISYRDQFAPAGVNPDGNIFYVGGRFDNFRHHWTHIPFNSHLACRGYLLYQAITQFAP